MSDPHQANTAHMKAFTFVKAYPEDQVLSRNEITFLSNLRIFQIQELEFKYRTEKLLALLKQDEILSEYLAFSKVSSGNKGYIIYWLG